MMQRNTRKILKRVLMACLPVCLLSAMSATGELVLVQDGVSLAPVVISANAPPNTRQAADELVEVIESISGARPEILEGEPDPLPESAIWVGHQPALDALFPDLDFAFQHPEEILIAANDRHVVIVGRDRIFNGVARESGTANAVYTFLRADLDVRWLWPGPLGEDLIARTTLSLTPFSRRYHPQIRSRSGVIRFETFPDWNRVQRLQLDSYPAMTGGHPKSHWWDTYHQSHPEIFALQPDGTRGGGETPYPNARTVKICKTNPTGWQLWLNEVEAARTANPAQNAFGASPNDGWFSGWCVCPDCLAWDHPEGEPRNFSWRGTSQPYVALSDRHVTYANTLARLLKERYPDEDYYVIMSAYGHSRPAPVEAVPDANVIISSVANYLFRRDDVDRGSSWGTTHLEQFKAWGKVASQIAWRPNTGNPGGWNIGLPHVPLTATAEEFKIAADHNAMRIFIDSVWEHWSTQGPLYYLMAHLAWDPGLEVDALMQDYYDRAFGPASAEMTAYWQLLEATSAYDDDLLAQANTYLDRALEAVEDAPGKYRERIEFVRAGLAFTRLMVENRALMTRYTESAGQAAEAVAKKILENWDQIGQLSLAQPHAINWRRNEPRHGRSAGYHPHGRNATIQLPYRE